MDILHHGWDRSHNDLWQWCQVLDRSSVNAKKLSGTASLRYKFTALGCTRGIHFSTGHELVQHCFHEILDNLRAINSYEVAYLTNISFEQWA
ncbi:hypothetical protein J1N35_021545 [Gossypium stocksii]|uniref:Uncharacterized protein n=1 Tax=Gossypium stocksii TaxID=47602 RepID=A0A9D3VGY0_9ROSI|nr:hypothetical protein J1N35_021545 [Gossypium stocksii]